MSYYKSAYYTYQPSQCTTTYSWLNTQDYQTQQRGYGQRTGIQTSEHRRHPPPSLTSQGYSQSSFDSPSSYLSTPKDLFGYEHQTLSTKKSSGAGADGGTSTTANQQQSGESISGMLSNFSKALGKCIPKLYNV